MTVNRMIVVDIELLTIIIGDNTTVVVIITIVIIIGMIMVIVMALLLHLLMQIRQLLIIGRIIFLAISVHMGHSLMAKLAVWLD